jgi:predicted transcriptional regulator
MVVTGKYRLEFKRKVSSEFLRVRKYLVAQMIKNEFSVEEISKTLKSSRGQIYYDIRKIKTKDMEEKNGNTKRR